MDAEALREAIAGLSPDKRALLERRLLARAPASAAGGDRAIPWRAFPGPWPLSYAQQRLWFLDRLHPGISVYNVPKVVRLGGALDVEALRAALEAIVARHEALRTVFVEVDGEPRQLVLDPPALGLPVVDLESVPEPGREDELRRRIEALVREPFDLALEPMLRATLLRVGPRDHVAVLNMHHIASDGWSTGVLIRELSALYEAFVAGRPSPLPPLPIQYADYAVWQRQWLEGPRLDRQVSYWRERLRGAPPALELPIAGPRPAVQTHRGGRVAARFPAGLLESLRALARAERVTLFMVLFGGFQTLLHRYTDQTDVVVGAAIAGRTRVQMEPLIGFFVNTLALRTDLSGDPTARELLHRVRDVAFGAYGHADLPFEKLVEELRPPRTLDRAPIVQVVFSHHDPGRPSLELAGLDVVPLDVDPGGAKFDLSLSITETADGITASAEYSTDLFERDAIARLLDHYRTLLAGMVADPDRPLSALPLLTDAERHRAIVEWNDTSADQPAAAIHDLVDAQAARTPDAVAVVDDRRRLTYGELRRRSDHLARWLRGRGAASGSLVGIHLARTVDMVVGLLGVLKAGGAYVPLDPTYPRARLDFMIGDARMPVVVTEAALVDGLPPHAADVVCIDRDWDAIAAAGGAPPAEGAVASADPAYVIYTSGSTGVPKGVVVPHRAVVRLVVNTDYVRLTSADVVAQASNVSFDAATFEIWGALVHGAKLVILSTDALLSPTRLARTLRTQRITAIFLTTALFNQVAREAPSAFSTVANVLFGGEASEPSAVAAVVRSGAPRRLLHVYGPTEATTFATWHLVDAVAPSATTVPIGSPIANTQVYLLDRHRNPVPVGAVGEICIGGPGVALGYLNRPDLTAERFLPNPFDAPSGRLYRTGDLGRYRANGVLEFVGRTDDMVKLRGHRIELGEIEATLRRHPDVRGAVVIVAEPRPGDKALVGYVTTDGREVAAGDLRNWLRATLPEYMVPSAVMRLDAFPLTANGKVDRHALPAPEGRAALEAAAPIAPSDELELRLTRLWEEALGVGPIGIHDDFFALGGHSLLAARLLAWLERAFGKPLPLAMLFHAPSIARFAEVMRREGWPAYWSTLVPIESRGSRPPLFAVPGVGGNVVSFVDLARQLGRDQPFYGLQSRGLDGVQTPLTTLADIAADHVRTLREVQPDGPYFLIGACWGALVAFEMAQQLRAQGHAIGFLALLDPSRPGFRHLSGRPRRTPRAVTVARFVARRLWLHARTLCKLRGPERRRYLVDRLGVLREMIARRDLFRGDRSEINQLAVYEANYRALRSYTPAAYPDRIHVFASADRSGYLPDERSRDWAGLAAAAEVHVVRSRNSGDMLQGQNAAVLAQRLLECLAEARRAGQR